MGLTVSAAVLAFGVSAARAQRMYWTDTGTGKIQRADLDGSDLQDILAGLGGPDGIALDLSGGKMYWTETASSIIRRGDLNGTGVENLVTSGLVSPRGIALDLAGGKMYWTDSGTNKIQRADLDGTAVEDLVATGLSSPVGIALDVGGGKMYWTTHGPDKIQRANLDGTSVEDLVISGLSKPIGIALDVAAGKMYWTDRGPDMIRRANLDGSSAEELVTAGLTNPFGVALDVGGGKMYWTGRGTHLVQRADLDGANVEDLITAGLDQPSGIALELTFPDCNNNGVPDDEDIANGTSQDDNMDGVPDECSAWDGGGGDEFWGTAQNWDDDTVPDNSEARTFAVSIVGLGVSVILNIDAEIDSLRLLEEAALSITFGHLTIETANGILNEGNLTVGDGFSIIAGAAFAITGTHPVNLDGPAAALTSLAPGNTLTNQTTVRGQGVINADFANEGVVSADVDLATLAIEGANAKVNDGTMEATNSATLLIANTTVTGSGTYECGCVVRGGCTPPPELQISASSVSGSAMSASDDGIIETGTAAEAGSPEGTETIDISGAVTIDSGGIYRGVPGSAASLTAGSVSILGTSGAGGLMALQGMMSLDVAGNLECGCSGALEGGCTPPPTLFAGGASSVDTGSMDVEDGGIVETGSEEGGIAPVISVAGALTIDSGGIYRGVPGSAASLSAGSVSILGTSGAGGLMALQGMMSLDVAGNLECGCSGAVEGGCTPPPTLFAGGASTVEAGSMDVEDGGIVEAGSEEGGIAPAINVAGALTIDSGGIYRGVPGSAASLAAGSVAILASNGAAGMMSLQGTMSVEVAGDLMTGCPTPLEGDCVPAPELAVMGSADVVVNGNLLFDGAVVLEVGPATGFSLAGDFDNRSTAPEIFNWQAGPLSMIGAFQALEAAGEDRGAGPSGFVDNFAIGTLELAAGTRVTVFDDFDNQQDGGTNCEEALYIDTLILQPGSRLTTTGCPVYYNNLINNGGLIITIADLDRSGYVDIDDFGLFATCYNGGDNPPAPSCPPGVDADLDDDGDVDLDDFGIFAANYTGGF